MIYLIDHEDSFTFNLAHILGEFDDIHVSNYYDIDKITLERAKTIVLSPGPGEPKDYPITNKIYSKYKGKKKIIGICLGFQQILFNENGSIVKQKKIYHGYQSLVKVTSAKSLFKKNKMFRVGRYHSLKLKEPFLSKNFEITMRCKLSNVAMAIENRTDQIYGFQFHPESFLTENGHFIIKKILSS